ncbi:MAG: M23 family metallopeptidase [Ilumatobacter sp.]
MTTDSTNSDLDIGTASAASSRLTRRRLFAGLGVGAAAIVVGRTGNASGAVAGQLNAPGQALVQASRITTTTSTTTTSTTTTTEPPIDDTLPPLQPGQIRFPILSGEDDSIFVLNNFGAPRGSRSHEGVDIMADHRLQVIAVTDGVLTREYEDSGSCSGAGNGWTLTDEVNDVVYKFFHLDEHAEGLEEGDSVVAGQVIGYVGETGTSGVCSTQFNNYHLHFEYRPNNSARDSFNLLQRPEFVTFAS